jgi:hypothetical protein
MLEQTTRRARRQLDLHPPLLMLLAALVALVTYGVLWLSVRHQHPYDGPTGAALVVLDGTLAVWAVFVAVIRRRAVSGCQRALATAPAGRGDGLRGGLGAPARLGTIVAGIDP